MFAIRNYGHLWSRANIFWGWQGVAGHLDGKCGTQLGKCRDQIAVYVLYDADLRPIYVGQAGYGENPNSRLFKRLSHHTTSRTKDYWKYFSWFGMRAVIGSGELSDRQWPNTRISGKKIREGLDEIEAVLIEVLNPRSNRRGPNWTGAEEYEQVFDERLIDQGSSDIVLDELRALRRELREFKESMEED